MTQEQFEAFKVLAALIGEYREISERIMTRYEKRNRYPLQSDRDRLTALNKKAEEIAYALKPKE